MMKRFSLLVFVPIALMALLASAGCKRAEGEAAATPVAEAVPAPAWKLRALDGGEVSSTDYAGKLVLLNFWATWCPPCVAEIPGFVALQKKYEGDLVVVGLSVDQGGIEQVKKFVAANKVNYPVLMADSEVVAAFGGMNAIPVSYLIDRQGRIRAKHVGLWEEQAVEAVLQPLLRDTKS